MLRLHIFTNLCLKKKIQLITRGVLVTGGGVDFFKSQKSRLKIPSGTFLLNVAFQMYYLLFAASNNVGLGVSEYSLLSVAPVDSL